MRSLLWGLFGAYAGINLSDAALTVVVVGRNIAEERSPAVRMVLSHAGPWSILYFVAGLSVMATTIAVANKLGMQKAMLAVVTFLLAAQSCVMVHDVLELVR